MSLTVNPVNDAPVAVADSYSTNEDTALTVTAPGVLGNDTDVDGDALTAILVAGPSHGSLALNGNGSFTYTPGANYNGSDAFTYKANDGQADSNVASVTIAVTPLTSSPVAKDDYTATLQRTAVTVEVLANDTDPNPGQTLSIGSFDASSGLGAAITHTSDGKLRYDPTPSSTLLSLAFGQTANDTFTYTIADQLGGTSTATVHVRSSGSMICPLRPMIPRAPTSTRRRRSTFLPTTVTRIRARCFRSHHCLGLAASGRC